jgi:hypothetical protein
MITIRAVQHLSRKADIWLMVEQSIQYAIALIVILVLLSLNFTHETQESGQSVSPSTF